MSSSSSFSSSPVVQRGAVSRQLLQVVVQAALVVLQPGELGLKLAVGGLQLLDLCSVQCSPVSLIIYQHILHKLDVKR